MHTFNTRGFSSLLSREIKRLKISACFKLHLTPLSVKYEKRIHKMMENLIFNVGSFHFFSLEFTERLKR